MLTKYLSKELVYRGKSGFGMSFPGVLPHSAQLAKDFDDAVRFVKERNLLHARLPASREELVSRYPNLCFALISLYRTIRTNELQNTRKQ
jgi:hypothetical protein